VRDIKELNAKHLQALKNTFNQTIQEQVLSNADREQYLSIYNQLQKLIVDKRPGNKDKSFSLNKKLSIVHFRKQMLK
jgi:hypothetical protein